MKHKRVKGSLFLERVDFDDVYQRKVGKNNKTSGKVRLPVNLIGKKVMIIVPKDRE